MLPQHLEQIDEAFLLQLIADGVQESGVLDFKACPPGKSDQDKSKFRSDVCAFANADGGDIVYGISEQDGKAAALAPTDPAIESTDKLQLRLGQLLDDIEPRVHGVRFHHVLLSNGYITVMRVPASFDVPHASVESAAYRFKLRVRNRNTDMTMEQLRSAFGRSAELASTARGFMQARLAELAALRAWHPLDSVPMVVVLVVPFAGLAGGRYRPDIRALASNPMTLLSSGVPPGWRGASSRVNMDGLIAYPGPLTGAIRGYRMVYRNGAMEAVQQVGEIMEGNGERVVLGELAVATYLREVNEFLGFSRRHGATGPALVRIAMIQTKGTSLDPLQSRGPSQIPGGRVVVCDRPVLELAEAWIDDLSVDGKVEDLVQDAKDVLWQSFGLHGYPLPL